MRDKINLLFGVVITSLFLWSNILFAQSDQDVDGNGMPLDVSYDEIDSGYDAVFLEASRDIDSNVPSESRMNIVAEVEILGAEIVSRENNEFEISFDLYNGRKVQPQVMYSVQLTKEFIADDGVKRNVIVHENVYSDEVSLGEYDRVRKSIKYVAPEFLDGKYRIFINSQNESGMPYAMSDLGEVTLKRGSTDFVLIDNDSCYVEVGGDQDQYPPQFGVDVSPNEVISLNCSVYNMFDEEMDFYPSVQTLERTRFGREISFEKGDVQSMSPGETRNFAFEIRKAQIPQAYEAVLVLVNEKNEVISGETVFRYVVRGDSASIQNARLDKDYYSQGDVAQLSLYVSSSADSFFSARKPNENFNEVVIKALISNGSNRTCSDTVSKNIKPMGDVEISVPITEDCLDPIVSVVVSDTSDNVLHRNSFAVETKSDKKKGITSFIPEEKGELVRNVFLVFLAVFLVSLLVVGAKKNKGLRFWFLVFALSSLFAFGSKDVNAVTFDIKSGHCGAYVSVGLDKNWYFPGESMTATSSPVRFACCNNVFESWANVYWGNDGGSKVLVTSAYQHRDKSVEQHGSNISYDGGGSVSMASPAKSGSHYANYRLFFTNSYAETGNYYSSEWFGVKGRPVAIIKNPVENSTYEAGENINFSGQGIKGVGGGKIDRYAWVRVRPGTPSYNGARCACADGFDKSGGVASSDCSDALAYGANMNSFSVDDLPSGSHRVCLNVRQLYADGTTAWGNAAQIDYVNFSIFAPTCGTYARKYSSSENDWGVGSFCSHGVMGPPPLPSFPTSSEPAVWSCYSADFSESVSCSATITNSKPVAIIDDPAPLQIFADSDDNGDENIYFQGRGSDPEGDPITVFEWRMEGCSGPVISNSANFTRLIGLGKHTAGLRVQDSNGNWSDCVSRDFSIAACTSDKYSCNIVSGDPNYCLSGSHCEKNHLVTRNCVVVDTCGNVTYESADACEANGESCQETTEEKCGDCPDTVNWIEVKP